MPGSPDRWTRIAMLLVFAVLPAATSAQSVDDSVGAVLHVAEAFLSDASFVSGTEAFCIRASRGGGRITPDSLEGESFETARPTGTTLRRLADSLATRLDLPLGAGCRLRGVPPARPDDMWVDAMGRVSAVLLVSAPVFIRPDSAVAHLAVSRDARSSRGWSCRLRRSGTGWEIASPCLALGAPR